MLAVSTGQVTRSALSERVAIRALGARRSASVPLTGSSCSRIPVTRIGLVLQFGSSNFAQTLLVFNHFTSNPPKLRLLLRRSNRLSSKPAAFSLRTTTGAYLAGSAFGIQFEPNKNNETAYTADDEPQISRRTRFKFTGLPQVNCRAELLI